MVRPARNPIVVLIALAGLATPIATGRADDAIVLEGAAAWQKLVGNTIVTTARSGGYTEFYAPDGELRRLDGDGTTKGQWSQQGDTTCFDYPDDDDHVCLGVKLQGTSGRFTEPDGTADPFELLPANPKNL